MKACRPARRRRPRAGGARPTCEPAPDPERLPPHPSTTVAQLLVDGGAAARRGRRLGAAPDARRRAGSVVARADVGAVDVARRASRAVLDAISGPLAEVGNTGVIIVGGAVAAVLALALTRRVGPVLVIVAVLVGEVLIFIDRPPRSSTDPARRSPTSTPCCRRPRASRPGTRPRRSASTDADRRAGAARDTRAVAVGGPRRCGHGGRRRRTSRLYRGAHHPDGRARQRRVRGAVAAGHGTAGRPTPTERKDGHRGLANPRAGPAARQATSSGAFG